MNGVTLRRMRQQQVVELIGMLAFMGILSATAAPIGDALGVPRSLGAIIGGGLSGFLFGEFYRRRLKRHRNP
jgi:hypothetical protein